MTPLTDARNLTPSSMPLPSLPEEEDEAWLICEAVSIVTSLPVAATVTLMALPAGAVPATSTLPAWSVARDFIVTAPVVDGVQLKDQLVVPVAACQVVPPFTETWTCVIVPASVAVPVIVTGIF